MAKLYTTQEFCTLAVSLYSIHVCSLTMWSRVWVFSEPRTGEPVKRELFANSVYDWL